MLHSCFALLFLTALTSATPRPDTITIISTLTSGPSIPTSAPSFTNQTLFQSAILNSTNFYRSEANTTGLTWNKTLATFAISYLVNTAAKDPTSDDCSFEHSGGPYGENLALGCSDAQSCVEVWGNERQQYDYGNPGFSEQTGHFTQLIWSNTTTVGCGSSLCGDKGWYLVCEYWPRGNVLGEFGDNVGKQINGTGASGAVGRNQASIGVLWISVLAIAWFWA